MVCKLYIMKTKTSFSQLYDFPGFRAKARFKSGVKGDPKARVVELARRQKKQFVPYAEQQPEVFMTIEYTGFEIYLPEKCGFMLNSSIGESIARCAVR